MILVWSSNTIIAQKGKPSEGDWENIIIRGEGDRESKRKVFMMVPV